MSYRSESQRLTKHQRWLIVSSILLMAPVLLDGFRLISLGEWRIAPFLILLVATGAMVGRDRSTIAAEQQRP